MVKRQRQDESENGALVAISSDREGKDKGLMRSVKRTSSLQAPIVALSGAHGVSDELLLVVDAARTVLTVCLTAPVDSQAEILDAVFSPDGTYIAAASADRTICEHAYGPRLSRDRLETDAQHIAFACAPPRQPFGPLMERTQTSASSPVIPKQSLHYPGPESRQRTHLCYSAPRPMGP